MPTDCNDGGRQRTHLHGSLIGAAGPRPRRKGMRHAPMAIARPMGWTLRVDHETDHARTRKCFLVTITLVAVNLAVVWSVPALPAQDLPQHLAYVKILLDYDNPDLTFRYFYRLPERFHPYATVYRILAELAHWLGVIG